MRTKRLAVNAMLSAMCAVLGFISLDFGNIKITFESVPIIVGALLFGPLDGLIIAGIGNLIYQVLRYGITVTTVLWILPYMVSGFLLGAYARRKSFSLTRAETLVAIIISELLITALNTGALYIDSKIYGYYSFAYIFGALVLRLVICVAKATAYGLVMPPLLRAVATHAVKGDD